VAIEEATDVLAEAAVEEGGRGVATVVATVGVEVMDGGGVGGDGGGGVGAGGEKEVDGGELCGSGLRLGESMGSSTQSVEATHGAAASR
jgi:hypothetical protein